MRILPSSWNSSAGGRGLWRGVSYLGTPWLRKVDLHLEILHEYICARCARREEVSRGDQGGENKEDGSEEAKDVLGAGDGGVHLGLVVPFPGG
jgi:hypothetical protein